mmetsp:Transcript_12857/g.24720  ORF Transcript_12857/g.24720 Transcript_12857/m.24720 type:complete len:848 (+) Transcript_12857:78-2621(+)
MSVLTLLPMNRSTTITRMIPSTTTRRVPWRTILALCCLCHVTTAVRIDDWAYPFLRRGASGATTRTSSMDNANSDHRELQENGTPYQSPVDIVGPSYVSGISYNKVSQALHMTGSTYGNAWGDHSWAGPTSACFYAVLDIVSDNTPTEVYSETLGNDGVSQACNNVLVDEDSAGVFLVGHSLSGGPLQDLENDATLVETVMFGMVADLKYTDIGDKAQKPTLVGGGVLQGSEVVYPIGVAKEAGENVVYVVSMELGGSWPSNAYSDGEMQDPTKVFPYGDDFSMRVAAHPINTPATGSIGLTRTLGSYSWNWDLSPNSVAGAFVPVQSIAGIVKLGDYAFVGGSTAGEGRGFGTRNEDGDDLDGFVSKFSASNGDIPSPEQVQGSLGGNPTWRAWAFGGSNGSGSNERVSGLCVSEMRPEFIFAVGSTEGHVESAVSEPKQKRAFLAKIRISNMSAVWIEHIEDFDNAAEVEGISCVVSGDGTSVYMAGNVNNGFIPESGVAQSYGESDVFITKVDVRDGATDGEVLFTRQFGSPASDTIAHRNGLEVVGANGDSVIIVGNTKGSMYRNKAASELDISNVFAVVMKSDGSFTPPRGYDEGEFQTPGTPPATTPVNPTPSTSTTTSTTPAEAVGPPLTEAPPTPPNNNESELSKDKSSRRREDWEALLIVLIVGICVTIAAMCIQQYLYHKRDASTDRSKVLDYLQNFDVEDIDLKHSATGGWHCSYVNDLSRGVNNQNSLSLDQGFMGDESDYQGTAFDPLNSAASPPTTPESKVLEDSLFVIDDGEETLTFGNDRSTRDGLGSAYRDTWRSTGRDSNGKGSTRSKRNLLGKSRGGRKNDTWGREII